MKIKEKLTKFVTFAMLLCMLLSISNMDVYAKTSIRMNYREVETYVGQTTQLRVVGTSKKPKWKVSDKTIASVSSKGLVKGKKCGVTYVYATIGSKTLKCKFYYKNASLNKRAITLNKGDHFALFLKGAKAKKWTSSNTKVASVNNGVVQANGVGKATITCVNTSGVNRTCSVEVKDESATMQTSFKNTLEGFMKQYNIKYLVDATPITNGEVNGCWYTNASTLYSLPTDIDLTKTYGIGFSDNNYIYTWIEKMTKEDNDTYFKGCKPYDYKIFTTYTDGPTSLSFNHTTFQTGETSGIMRVVNIVPDSTYEWSSSDDSVVSLTHDVTITNAFGTFTDPVAVHIHANKAGTATITCKVTYPGGEIKVCTSEIYVSDTILEENLPYETFQDTLNMDEIMAKVESELENRKEYDTTLNNFNIGLDFGTGSGNETFDWTNFYNYCSKGVIFPGPYYQQLNQAVIDNAYNYSAYNLEYQGYNENGIQFRAYAGGGGIDGRYVDLYHK